MCLKTAYREAVRMCARLPGDPLHRNHRPNLTRVGHERKVSTSSSRTQTRSAWTLVWGNGAGSGTQIRRVVNKGPTKPTTCSKPSVNEVAMESAERSGTQAEHALQSLTPFKSSPTKPRAQNTAFTRFAARPASDYKWVREASPRTRAMRPLRSKHTPGMQSKHTILVFAKPGEVELEGEHVRIRHFTGSLKRQELLELIDRAGALQHAPLCAREHL